MTGQAPHMTTTRQQLEDVITRQLMYQRRPSLTVATAPLVASRRAILAAVDDWAAGQVAAAVTPPAPEIIPLLPEIRFRKMSRRERREFRRRFLAAQGQLPIVLPEADDTTGGTP